MTRASPPLRYAHKQTSDNEMVNGNVRNGKRQDRRRGQRGKEKQMPALFRIMRASDVFISSLQQRGTPRLFVYSLAAALLFPIA